MTSHLDIQYRAWLWLKVSLCALSHVLNYQIKIECDKILFFITCFYPHLSFICHVLAFSTYLHLEM